MRKIQNISHGAQMRFLPVEQVIASSQVLIWGAMAFSLIGWITSSLRMARAQLMVRFSETNGQKAWRLGVATAASKQR
jgi:hypothetical protein